MPWPFGGSSLTFQPRYVVSMGSTHSGWNSPRSSSVITPPRSRTTSTMSGGPLVEPVAALFGDPPERARQGRVPERLARPGRSFLDQEGGARLRIRAEHLHRAGPQPGGDLHHRKTVLGVPDRRGQIGSQGKLAEPLVHRRPAADGPRDRDRVYAAIGKLALHALAVEEIERHSRRRPPARVHPVQLVLLRQVHDGKEVAADAVRGGLHHALGRVGGDGGVHGVSAALEDLHRRLGGKGLAGRRDAVLRRGDGPAGHGQRGCHHEGQGHHGGLLSPG